MVRLRKTLCRLKRPVLQWYFGNLHPTVLRIGLSDQVRAKFCFHIPCKYSNNNVQFRPHVPPIVSLHSHSKLHLLDCKFLFNRGSASPPTSAPLNLFTTTIHHHNHHITSSPSRACFCQMERVSIAIKQSFIKFYHCSYNNSFHMVAFIPFLFNFYWELTSDILAIPSTIPSINLGGFFHISVWPLLRVKRPIFSQTRREKIFPNLQNICLLAEP